MRKHLPMLFLAVAALACNSQKQASQGWSHTADRSCVSLDSTREVSSHVKSLELAISLDSLDAWLVDFSRVADSPSAEAPTDIAGLAGMRAVRLSAKSARLAASASEASAEEHERVSAEASSSIVQQSKEESARSKTSAHGSALPLIVVLALAAFAYSLLRKK